MAAPYTKRLALHTLEAIRRLNAGEDGAAVVDFLRQLKKVDEDGQTVPHYTVHSLATTVCTVKKKALESGRRHDEYDDSKLRPFAESVPGVAEFLNAPLLTQWQLQKVHEKHPSWPKDAEQALAAIKLMPSNLDSLKVTDIETMNIKRNKRTAKRGRMKSVVCISNAANLLAEAIDVLENASVHDTYTALVSSLAMVCGRRRTELLNGKSTFTPIGERMVMFDGQLKKQIGQAKPYPIPLLCTTATFLHGLAILRQKQGDVLMFDNQQIEARYYAHFTPDRLQSIMPGVTHFHLLRSMYVKYVDHCFDHNYAFNYLACEILGHDDETESLSYISVKLKLEDIQSIHHSLGTLCIEED